MSGDVAEGRGASNPARSPPRSSLARRDRSGAPADRRAPPRLLGIFVPWRLEAYGYSLAAAYAVVFFLGYRQGVWLVGHNGLPLTSTDFPYWWIGGRQALQGAVASVYDPAQFQEIAAGIIGSYPATHSFPPYFPYPPFFFFILAPLGLMPFVVAFLAWEAVGLLGCVTVVHLIVRKPAAVALVLASPFAAFDFLWAQSGFLRASLLGGALLALERRPVLAGVLIGCLTYKPQFGVLIPVALVAAGQWRALASAALTTIMLAAASVGAFGIGPWEALPRQLLAQSADILLHSGTFATRWGALQTVYGLVRAVHGNAALAWTAQGLITAVMVVIVWQVWRSPVRYDLKAALLSAATLIATPYAWSHDFVVAAIPIAFLAKDQIRCGLLRGEQTTLIALFAIAFAILVSGDRGLPLGPVFGVTLVALILRRAHDDPIRSAVTA